MLFLPVSLYVLCYITLYLNSILTMFVSYFYFDNWEQYLGHLQCLPTKLPFPLPSLLTFPLLNLLIFWHLALSSHPTGTLSWHPWFLFFEPLQNASLARYHVFCFFLCMFYLNFFGLSMCCSPISSWVSWWVGHLSIPSIFMAPVVRLRAYCGLFNSEIGLTVAFCTLRGLELPSLSTGQGPLPLLPLLCDREGKKVLTGGLIAQLKADLLLELHVFNAEWKG